MEAGGGSPSGSAGTGFAAVGLAAFAVVCCAGLPLAIAAVGSIAVGVWLGAGAAVIGLGLVGALLVTARRRQRCDAEARSGTASDRGVS